MSQFFLSTTDMFEKEAKIRKFVLFSLNNNLFGVPVEQVSQVANFEKSYKVPGTPDYVLGVMNLRGRVVTLVDLKNRLGLLNKESEDLKKKQIVFIEILNQFIGMVVDKVISLRSIPIDMIKEELELITTNIDLAFLKGAATLEEGIVVLLNLDMVLSEYEVEEITQHREKLEAALKKKDKVVIPEDKLIELNLEDDFYSLSDEAEENNENVGDRAETDEAGKSAKKKVKDKR